MSQPHLLQKVLFDCERMKYPHTGLYHFCLHLGKALLTIAKSNHKKILFYTNEASVGIFGKKEEYIKQYSYQKYFNLPHGGIDVWHATYQGSMYLPKAKKVKKVITVHDLNFMYDDAKMPSKKNKYLQQLQQKIDRSDVVTAISEYTKADLLKCIDMKGKEVSVIYNGCNIPTHITPSKPDFINENEPFLFTLGTITTKKNFHVLPALLAGNNYKLIIAGITQEEIYREKIIQQATLWNVSDRVILPGPVSEKEKWWLLQHCQAFVFPSLSEGFGLPVIEAMYFGKPVVLSNLSSLPEIGGDAAYYFNTFEAEDMQQILADGLADYAKNNRAARIKERAAIFSWQHAAQQYMKIYNSLA
jgi:glycosyltransferase involved in cell wall biosynthesis